jgi:DNA/RNA non-specific endonuclease
MVQGHLLNQNLGGPGSTMSNLTPITQSTNRQHEKKAESEVKDLVITQKKIVNYDVWADYSKYPTAAALAQNTPATKAEIADIANYSQNMAYQLWCQWEVIDSKGNTVGTPPMAQLIWNEGK